MNITIEQLVKFGRFPYSKGRMKQKKTMTKWNMLLTYYSLMKLNIVILKHYLEVSDNACYIAMTIAQDTDILLDEPLNNLDMKHSVQIMQTLRDFMSSVK